MAEGEINVGGNGSNVPLRPVLVGSGKSIEKYSTFLRHFFVGLLEEAQSIAFVCPRGSVQSVGLSLPVEMIEHPFFNLKLMWRQNWKILVSRLEKFKPTVIHCICVSQVRLAHKLAEYFDIPFVLMLDRPDVGMYPFFLPLSNCGYLLSCGEGYLDELGKKYPSMCGRVGVVRPGTFVEDVSCCFSSPYRVTSMISVKSLERVEEFEYLLGAIRHLAIEGYEFVFMIVGSGNAEMRIRKLIRGLGLSQIVYVVPEMPPLRKILKGADIFIETDPNHSSDPNLLEAMSVGMAVAACSSEEGFLKDRETALFFDGDDEISIYSCLRELCDKREFARQLAMNGQSELRANNSVSKMVGSIVDSYRISQLWKRGELVDQSINP